MRDDKHTKGPLGILALGMTFMGALYGWIVYAGEIEDDLSKVSSSIVQTSNNQILLDPNLINMLQQVGNSVEAQHNTTINTELYSKKDIAPADAMITNHFSYYCQGPSESGGVGSFGLGCTSDALMQFGDIKLSSILSGTVYDDKRAKAAQDFLTNLLDPPNGPNVSNFQANVPINASTVTGDPTLKTNFVQALSDEALLSVVRQPFSEMMAKRTPGSTGVSEMQMMEQQAIQRVMSLTWPKLLQQMQPQQIAQDQAVMQAFQVWMEYQRYRQMERVEALLATLVLQNFRASKLASATAEPPSQQQIDSATQQAGGSTGSAGQ